VGWIVCVLVCSLVRLCVELLVCLGMCLVVRLFGCVVVWMLGWGVPANPYYPFKAPVMESYQPSD
jgi:hypothetical protein